MPPEKALEYFAKLVPTLGKDPQRYGQEMRRKAFTLAAATEETLLARVQQVVTMGLEEGQSSGSLTRQVQTLLDKAGVSPKNPQYCFLPGTMVEGAVLAASKANYDGPAVEIETADGRRLSVTINHPILTADGWKSAGDIQEGENLLCYGIPVETLANQASSAPLASAQRRAVHNQKTPARIEDVFESILEECSAANDIQRPVCPLDFHGDAAFMDGYIDRVRPNRVLQGIGEAGAIQESGEFCLMDGLDVTAIPASVGCGLLDFGSERLSNTALARGEVLNGPRLYLWRRVSPSVYVSVGSAANLDPRLFHASDKRPMGDAQLYRKLIRSLPGLVTTNCVVKVKRIRWTGHVYNLHTATGFIVSQGIITSNCEMVVRTNVMDALNDGAFQELRDPAASETFPIWRYDGIKDGRQGKDHEPHFGRYYPVSASFAEVRGNRPFNCRCSFTPVSKWEWSELQAKGARVATFSEDGYYHGPTPPGEGWVSAGTGPHGGKLWKREAKDDAGGDDGKRSEALTDSEKKESREAWADHAKAKEEHAKKVASIQADHVKALNAHKEKVAEIEKAHGEKVAKLEAEHKAALDAHESRSKERDARRETVEKDHVTDAIGKAGGVGGLPPKLAEGGDREEYEKGAKAYADMYSDRMGAAYGKEGHLSKAMDEIGANGKEKDRVAAIAERGKAAVEKAGEKYQKAVSKHADAMDAVAAHKEKMPPEPVEPDEPDAPDELSDDATEGEKTAHKEATEKYEKDYAAYEKDKAKYDSDQAKYEKAEGRLSDLEEKASDAEIAVEDTADTLDATFNEHQERLSDAVSKVQDRIVGEIDKEEEKDPEPDEPDMPDDPDYPEEPDEPDYPDEPEEPDLPHPDVFDPPKKEGAA